VGNERSSQGGRLRARCVIIASVDNDCISAPSAIETTLKSCSLSSSNSTSFAHPRSLVSDFTVAEQVLKAYFRRVRGKSLLQPNPLVIVHPLGEHEGGLTQVELRALRELAFGAGASEARIWQGPQLTDEQVLANEYPATGRMLSE